MTVALAIASWLIIIWLTLVAVITLGIIRAVIMDLWTHRQRRWTRRDDIQVRALHPTGRRR